MAIPCYLDKNLYFDESLTGLFLFKIEREFSELNEFSRIYYYELIRIDKFNSRRFAEFAFICVLFIVKINL